ncbi:MAG: VWA domain-containing protein [Muribaculaceae bacterium]|nr:VWA domain-containing protein [Muribaculaceae bacterium]
MNIFKIFYSKKEDSKTEPTMGTETVVTDTATKTVAEPKKEEPQKAEQETKEKEEAFAKVAPREVGKLDMVIAFDTTGSMAAYIDAVRHEVADLIPRLFKDNEDLRLGIVAFGDYCDMPNAKEFGDAYQCIQPTDNANDLIKFVRTSHNTSGGDWDEFYELVIKKIIEDTPWREGSTRSILLISDATPHPVGYTYMQHVVDNKIDWRTEAEKAVALGIKIDTVTITDEPWYKELSAITKGVSVPFKSGHKTARLVEASVCARGSMTSRARFRANMQSCQDDEMREVYNSYLDECDSI